MKQECMTEPHDVGGSEGHPATDESQHQVQSDKTVAQEVEHLPSTHDALGLIPGTP